jgi:hypothetical protein
MPQGVWGGGRKLKFTIYVPLIPQMLHIKFENNWSCGYQEVKNVQILTHSISYLALPWRQNYYSEDYQFHNFGRGLPALHYHAFSFSSTCAVVLEDDF